MNKIIPSKLLAKSRSKVLISPLGLLVLAACSGGNKSGDSGDANFLREGDLVKGPLQDALAFLDYDGDKLPSVGSLHYIRKQAPGRPVGALRASYSGSGSGVRWAYTTCF